MATVRRSLVWAFALSLLALSLIACGGSTTTKTAVITGRVTDVDGLPVRGARVWTIDGDTRTTSNGSYRLPAVREGIVTVRAELVEGSVRYFGQNSAITFEAEQTQSINVMIAPESRRATIFGNVRDREGFLLEGASVFAFGGGNLSSARSITNENGNYELTGLISGLDYELNAGGQSFGSDSGVVNLRDGERLRVDFVLDNPGFPNLPAVSDLGAITWVSQPVSRSDRLWEAYEQVKREFDPARGTRPATSRTTASGAPIEVELEWTPLVGPDILGYSISRARGGGSFREIDYWREPLGGVYIDTEDQLAARTEYTYRVNVLGTRYPDDPNAIGPGTSITVETLDDLRLNSVGRSPLRFRWQNGSSAETFVVYVFDEFPSLGVESIWNNEGSPIAGAEIVYDGPALVAGRTYYYLVLGLANGVDSRTLSTVGSFSP